MSLDVYLKRGGDERVPCEACAGSGWAQSEAEELYTANITHNLGRMAREAGLYEALWCPEEIGIERAGALIPRLQEGLLRLQAEPERFRAFNPGNGWGSYEGLVRFVDQYLTACESYPDARVKVSS